MSNDRAIVIEVDKKSYVGRPVNQYQWDHAVINGRGGWPKAKGDERFVVVDQRIDTIELRFPPLKITTKYELRVDLIGSGKPRWITPAEHERLPEQDAALYAPVQEEREQAPRPIEFDRIDATAPPRTLPAGIQVQAPHHIDVRSWFWWTLPCTASADYVFDRLLARVEKLDHGMFAVTAYRNTQHMRVEARSFTLGNVEFRPVGALLYVDRESKRQKGEVAVQAISGADLDDCIAKVEAWCDAQMASITAALAVKDCPCCGRPLKGRKPQITARESGRRLNHDIRR